MSALIILIASIAIFHWGSAQSANNTNAFGQPRSLPMETLALGLVLVSIVMFLATLYTVIVHGAW